jgi:hypothetical protein
MMLGGCSARRRNPVLHWRERLVCSRYSSRQVDMVLTGTERG